MSPVSWEVNNYADAEGLFFVFVFVFKFEKPTHSLPGELPRETEVACTETFQCSRGFYQEVLLKKVKQPLE